jgi:hypothetical protein
MKTNLFAYNQTIRGLSLLTALLLLGTGAVLGAETITLNPSADTALRDGVPNNNFGAAIDLPVGVGTPGGPRNRVLLRFSLDAIPANATITSANLQLSVALTGTGPANFGVHRVLRDWGEGAKTLIISGAPATEGEATWNARFHPDVLWGAAGGQAGTDFIDEPSASSSIGGTGTVAIFTSARLMTDIQSWLDQPEANFGWLLMALNEPAGTGKRIASRENANESARPLLTIEYTVDETPEQLRIFDTALIGDQIRFSFQADSNRPYAVESRSEVATGGWEVLQNFPAQETGTTMHFTNSISSAESYFRVSTP